jgi:hypothetical protein
MAQWRAWASGLITTLGTPLAKISQDLLGGAVDGVQVPVFGLQYQQPAPGVQHHKVRVGLLGANGHVVPQQVVVIQLLLQPLGQTPLAGGHA